MIVVLGIGRCGSSLTTKVLEERLGYDMGGKGAVGSAAPLGTWERDPIHTWTHAIEHGRSTPAIFRLQFQHYIGSMAEPWGFKTPRVAYVLEEITELLPEAVYVWCDRDPLKCAESAHKRWGGPSYDQILTRWKLLQPWLEILKPYRVDFNRHREEPELEAELKAALYQQLTAATTGPGIGL